MEQSLYRLHSLIREVRTISPRMEMQDLETLLLVALHPGISPLEVSEKTGISGSAASRAAYRLSAEQEPGVSGPSLLSVEINPQDRRRKQLYLTPTGQRFVGSLTAEFGRRTA